VSLSLTPDMIRVPFPRFLGNSYNWKAGEHVIDAMERKHGLRCASRRALEHCSALSCTSVHRDGLLIAYRSWKWCYKVGNDSDGWKEGLIDVRSRNISSSGVTPPSWLALVLSSGREFGACEQIPSQNSP
jgi:hypothetical protein